MKIAFYSNFLSSHQRPFCDELYQKDNCEFRFIASKPLSETRKAMGWQEEIVPYVIPSYQNEEAYQEAKIFIKEADVLIYGSDEETEFLQIAVNNKNCITFMCGERIYKKGRWRALSPRGLKRRWNTYFKYPKKNVYMLCSGAYAAGDYAMLGSYIGRCYKWGYFTKVDNHDIETILQKKISNHIFWAGRLLELKHPEKLICLAEYLQEKDIPFQIEIAGDGPLREELQNQINERGLTEYVHLLGVLTQEETYQHMDKAGVYVATSNYEEGWGAVINEAMSRGCAVVASDAMGAVPFLIKDGENGYSFQYKDKQKLCWAVEQLLADSDLHKRISSQAYSTMRNLWNPEVAAERFFQLAVAKKEGKRIAFLNGPCSKAYIFRKER